MYWYHSDLAFKVHLKENQILNYVDADSTHTKPCLKAILSGVIRRLTALTTVTPENQDTTIDKLYPDHIAALRRAKLIPHGFRFPILGTNQKTVELQNREKEKNKTNPSPQYQAAEAKRKRSKKRMVWFCIGFSTIWG